VPSGSFSAALGPFKAISFKGTAPFKEDFKDMVNPRRLQEVGTILRVQFTSSWANGRLKDQRFFRRLH
jgi:hypothetical protein